MSNDVTINVKTNDQASQGLGKIADNTETMTQRAGKSISGLGQKIGGELGEVIAKAGEGFESLGGHVQSGAEKMAAAGGVAAGLGVTLMAFGSAAKQSEQQLEAAVSATGDSFDQYSKQVDDAKSKGEDFGHSGVEVEQVLATLTEKTGSLATSLQYLNLVENLSAAQHISLMAAANMVAKALDGNTKLFKQYGLAVQSGAQSTQQISDNLDQLATKLGGQAAAASDTFTGKLESMKQHATDLAERFANDVGPALTLVGTGVGIVSGVVDIFASRSARMAAAQLAAAEATVTEGAAAGASVGPNVAAAASEDALAVSAGGARAASLGFAASLGPVGIAGALFAVALAMDPVTAKIKDFLSSSSGVTQSLADSTEMGKALTVALQADYGALGAHTRAAFAAQYQMDVTANSISKAGVSVDDVTDALGLSDGAWQTQLQTWAKANGLSKTQIAVLQNMRDVYEAATTKSESLTAATGNLASSTIKLGATLDNTSKEFKAGADTATRYDNALKGILETTTGAAESSLAFQDSLSQLTQSVKDNGTSLAANTDKGRANMEQMLQSIDKINGIAEAQTKQHLSTDIVNGTLKDNEDALRKAAKAAGYNSDQVDFMIKKYALVPGKIETSAYLDASNYLNNLDTVIAKLGYLNGLENSDPGAYGALKGGFNQFVVGAYKQQAAGGISSGFPQTMNERGSEGVRLPNGSMVMSAEDMDRMSSGGGGGATQIIFGSDGSAVGDFLLAMVRKSVRVQGGNVQKVLGQG